MIGFNNTLSVFTKWMRRREIWLSVLLAQSAAVVADDIPVIQPSSAPEVAPTASYALLSNLISQGDFEAAFELAQALAAAAEGEPAFDWLYGRAALESGHFSEARFTFERLLLLAPEHPRYRLEYARTLAALGEVDAARSAFGAVLAQNPPAAVQTKVQAAIDQLDAYQQQQSRSWQAFISVGAGHDSNISSATTEQQVGLFELPDSARERSSPLWSLRTGVSKQHRISERRSLGFDARSYHKHNTETSAYNLDSAQLRPFYRWQSPHAQQEVALLQQWVWLDGQLYQQDSGLDLRWLHQFNAAWAGLAQLGLVRRDHPLAAHYDSWQARLNLAALLASSPRWQQRIGLQAIDESERSDGDAANLKTLLEGYWSGDWHSTVATRVQTRLSVYQSDYHARHPVFGRTRRDTGWRAALGWQWQWAPRWTFQAETSFTTQDSNLALYDYERALAELRLQWSL